MELILLTDDGWAEGLVQRAHAPLGSDALRAELLRAELLALGAAPRWLLVDRVAADDSEREPVQTVLRRLEAQGEVCAGPGGWLAPAPLRAVRLAAGRYLLLGTVTTGRLRTALGAEVQTAVLRRVVVDQEIAPAVAALGGCVVTLEAWAGLQRTPAADAGWLALLAERCREADELEAGFAPTWEDCQRYVSTAAEAEQRRRWRRSPDNEGLVRARQAGGFFCYGLWGADRHGTPRRLVLRRDEALRTQFALDREAGAALALRVHRMAGGVELEAGLLLPSAEYRCLVACGERLDGEVPRYRIHDADWRGLVEILSQRLGVILNVEDV